MKFLVEFVSVTGHRRAVLVDLAPAEIADVEQHLDERGPGGPGGPDGPIARAYAMRHAPVPPGFTIDGVRPRPPVWH